MVILPTHTCFDDALEMLEQAIKANDVAFDSGELKLVHGICVAPDGHDYAHAWVESLGQLCWFVGVVEGQRQEFATTIEEFYKEFQVKEATYYTPAEAVQLNHAYNTYGPWVERYLRLCKNFDESRMPLMPKP